MPELLSKQRYGRYPQPNWSRRYAASYDDLLVRRTDTELWVELLGWPGIGPWCERTGGVRINTVHASFKWRANRLCEHRPGCYWWQQQPIMAFYNGILWWQDLCQNS